MKVFRLWVLILMGALFGIARADKPPAELMAHITKFTLAHDKRCNWRHMTAVECLIFLDVERDDVYIVLFTEDQKHITHVIYVEDRKEHILWVNRQFVL